MHILLAAAAASLAAATDLTVLSWNVESGRNDPAVISRELTELNTQQGRARYDLICLTEVKSINAERYRRALRVGEADYELLLSSTGNDDRIALLYRRDRFRRIDSGTGNGRPAELTSHAGETFPAGGNRRPCLVKLKDVRNDDLEFLFMGNHLNRGTNRTRQTQARLLREWVKVQTLPVIAAGDYNFDFDFQHLTGNQAMSIFLRDPASEGGRFAWNWVIPDTEVTVVGRGGARHVEIVGELQDTNWYDGDRDGEDDYPDSFLDFVFLGAAARSWDATATVIVRAGDFPDGPKKSDHRPLAAVIAPLPVPLSGSR
ncbi:MAG: hypothetical protein NXI04_08005 [Planctomycetaceae bacterium]|nr:hypothetical protein [Planctomycetaceae bacterium]